jgi:hypothetical protein
MKTYKRFLAHLERNSLHTDYSEKCFEQKLYRKMKFIFPAQYTSFRKSSGSPLRKQKRTTVSDFLCCAYIS